LAQHAGAPELPFQSAQIVEVYVPVKPRKDRMADMYYGTVARYRVKPGHEERFLEQMKGFESSPPPGWIYTTLFRGAADPKEIWMSVVFENEDLYKKNADSSEMDQAYRAMLEHLEAEPEWHDGHIIHEAMRKS
jgi:quinol monooxygenase YgiN